MDDFDSMLGSFARDFERSLSKHEDVYEKRIGQVSDKQETAQSKTNSKPWHLLSNHERNIRLYGENYMSR